MSDAVVLPLVGVIAIVLLVVVEVMNYRNTKSRRESTIQVALNLYQVAKSNLGKHPNNPRWDEHQKAAMREAWETLDQMGYRGPRP